MKTFLYRRGDGNDGNFARTIVTLTDEQKPWAALAALVVNDFIPGCPNRRHIIKHIETDGEPDYGINAWVHEGRGGEQAFGAAWLTAELQPLSDADCEHYTGQGRPGMQPQTLRESLDRAAWRFYVKGCKP